MVVADVPDPGVRVSMAAARTVCELRVFCVLLFSYADPGRTGKHVFPCVPVIGLAFGDGRAADRVAGAGNQHLDLAQGFAEKMVDRTDLNAVRFTDMAFRPVPPRPGPHFCRLCRPRTDAAPALLSFPEANRIPSLGHLLRGGCLFCAGTHFPFRG